MPQRMIGNVQWCGRSNRCLLYCPTRRVTWLRSTTVCVTALLPAVDWPHCSISLSELQLINLVVRTFNRLQFKPQAPLHYSLRAQPPSQQQHPRAQHQCKGTPHFRKDRLILFVANSINVNKNDTLTIKLPFQNHSHRHYCISRERHHHRPQHTALYLCGWQMALMATYPTFREEKGKKNWICSCAI